MNSMQPKNLHPVVQVKIAICLIGRLHDGLKEKAPLKESQQREKISEKQLETLRKARKAKAAKAKGVKAPPQPTEEVSPTEKVSPTEESLPPIKKQEIPERVFKPTPKTKKKPTLIEVRTYHEDAKPTSKTEMFYVF
jgi:hypothetical protein